MSKLKNVLAYLLIAVLSLQSGFGGTVVVSAQTTENAADTDVSEEADSDDSGEEGFDESKIIQSDYWKCIVNADNTLTIGGYAVAPANANKTFNLEIPSELNVSIDGESEKMKVSTVGFGRANGNDWPNYLESVTIPEGVEKVDDYAFFSCKFLESVEIPDSVQKIGKYAFWVCNNLTTVNIPEGITTIEEGTFDSCSQKLIKITLPSTIKCIEKSAFRECFVLEELVWQESTGDDLAEGLAQDEISDDERYIGNIAFLRCHSLKKIDIPEGFTKIESSAFTECDSIAEVNLPSTLKTIGYDAFEKCYSLEQIDLPDSIEEIGNAAFHQCSKLTKVTLPANLKKLNESLFWLCEELTDVTLPASLEEIGWGAFNECSSLAQIELPDTLTSIGLDAFNGCKQLKEINIPDSVTEIGTSAFEECEALETVQLPSKLEDIDVRVFKNCKSLKSIEIPKTAKLESISHSAFSGCSSLKNIILPSGVRRIYKQAFANCTSLEKIHIPQSVKSIEDDSFEGWEKLTIYTPKGSYAVQYANAQEPPIPVVEEEDDPITGEDPATGDDPTTGEDPVTGEPGEEGIESIHNPTIKDGTVEWSYIYFGNYPQSDATGQTAEPIKWRVLSVKDKDAFLVADANLDVQKYHDADQSCSWENCTMRSWLNGYGSGENLCEKDCSKNNFIDRAFTDDEQAAIKLTTVKNEDSPEYPEEEQKGNDTQDKIFLLSYQEVTNPDYGFSEDGDNIDGARVFKNTAYTANGGTIHTTVPMAPQGDADEWWLRSKTDSLVAMWVDDSGSICSNQVVWGEEEVPIYAVCPALHLDLSSTVWSVDEPAPVTECEHGNTGVENLTTATCTEAGYSGDSYCLDCNAKLKTGGIIPAKGHHWNAGVVTEAATALEGGVKTFTCTECGATKTEALKAIGVTTGTKLTDSTYGNGYKVTSLKGNSGTLEYVEPVNSDVVTVAVPATIKFGDVSYKVTAIAPKAFKNCRQLKTVTIGKNVTTIGDQAFYNCKKLTKITIPAKVNKIGKSAFYGCKKLKNITVKTTKLTNKNIGSKAFKGIHAKAVIKVPKSRVAAYKKLLRKKGAGSKVNIKK